MEDSRKLRGDVILAKYIVESVKKKTEGEYTDYLWILSQLKPNQLNDVTMCRWLSALKRCITVVDDEKLLGTTLNFPWIACDGCVADLYIDYLEDLVSAHPEYLLPVLHRVCSLLVSPDHPSNAIYENLHNALHCLLSLIQRAHSLLVKVLEEHAPYKGREAKYQEAFVRNCLHVTTYCPSLRQEVLSLVMLKMLQIDVEVPQSVRDSVDQVVTQEEEGVQFDVDMDSDMVTSNSLTEEARPQSCPTSPSLLPEYSSLGNMTDPKADCIDIMMTLLFEYIHSLCYNNSTGKFNVDVTLETFQILLKIFKNQILLTHGSSHVQFLLFKVSSYSESIPTLFLDFLWEKFQDLNTAAIVRQSCASYIASFIARAKYLPVSTARLCLTAMMDWVHQYMALVSTNNLRPDVSRHGPFYSICQAVFYIVVFRHKQILETEKGHQFLVKLDFSKLIFSKLNPLKVCLSTVVDLFASVSCKHEIVFCYTIIEQNKRLLLPLGATSSELETSSSCMISNLATFFPFDPYYLTRSLRFVSDLYQEWEGEDKEDDLFATSKTFPEQPSSTPSSLGSLVFSMTSP